jgi:hypothetical protein
VAVELIKVELLVLVELEVVAQVEQVVLTITVLLELPIRAVAVVVALFKPTHLIEMVAMVALA